MQGGAEWVQIAIVGLFALFFVWVAVAALRRARRRRRAELRESAAFEMAGRAEEAQPGAGAAAPAAGPASPAAPEATVGPELAADNAAGPASPAAPAAAVGAEPAADTAPPPLVPAAAGRDDGLARGLARTRASFRERLGQIFGRHLQLDATVLGELEEALLTADVGVGLTTRLISALRADVKARRLVAIGDVRRALEEHLLGAMRDGAGVQDPFAAGGARPRVILFVGVNGVGKTTTIGKVAALARARGLDVVLAAADTFRAAAVEQLSIWGERTKSRIIRGEAGADPASVVFNAVEHAVKTGSDVVLADTAGRLHTKTQLMEEIKKVKRSAGKARAGAPDEIWLVVDATTGQNALQQAREFHQALGLTGVILTKLDGTAKGGVVVAIADALGLPVRFVGVGERPEDLRPFEPEAFVGAMFA